MTAGLAAVALLAPASSIFLPPAGSVTVFEHKQGFMTMPVVRTVGEPIELNDRLAFPVTTKIPEHGSMTFFASDNEGEFLIEAYDKDKPLKDPFTLGLEPDVLPAIWTADGIRFEGEQEMKGLIEAKSAWGETREVLGDEVKTLIVTFTSRPPGEKSHERGLMLTQTFIYAEGFGLIEWKHTMEASGKKRETSRKIISFDRGGESS
jgi:hypothetical protein